MRSTVALIHTHAFGFLFPRSMVLNFLLPTARNPALTEPVKESRLIPTLMQFVATHLHRSERDAQARARTEQSTPTCAGHPAVRQLRRAVTVQSEKRRKQQSKLFGRHMTPRASCCCFFAFRACGSVHLRLFVYTRLRSYCAAH